MSVGVGAGVTGVSVAVGTGVTGVSVGGTGVGVTFSDPEIVQPKSRLTE